MSGGLAALGPLGKVARLAKGAGKVEKVLPKNSWNAFQKQMGGLGLSKAEPQRLYSVYWKSKTGVSALMKRTFGMVNRVQRRSLGRAIWLLQLRHGTLTGQMGAKTTLGDAYNSAKTTLGNAYSQARKYAGTAANTIKKDYNMAKHWFARRTSQNAAPAKPARQSPRPPPDRVLALLPGNHIRDPGRQERPDQTGDDGL